MGGVSPGAAASRLRRAMAGQAEALPWAGMALPLRGAGTANPAGVVDTPIASSLAFDRQLRRATGQHRSV